MVFTIMVKMWIHFQLVLQIIAIFEFSRIQKGKIIILSGNL